MFLRRIRSKKPVFGKIPSYQTKMSKTISVLLPLVENLVSWISIRYVYSSQILECSSKNG